MAQEGKRLKRPKSQGQVGAQRRSRPVRVTGEQGGN